MFKRILPLTMALLASLVVFVAVSDADYNERLEWSEAFNGLGTTFSVADEAPANDPDAFWPLLREMVVEHRVNVFRKTSGWDQDQEPFITYYIVLSGDTALFDMVRLRSGRLLTPEETQEGGVFLSSEEGVDGQVGVIDDIDHNDSFSACAMEALFDRYPVAGDYAVEASDRQTEERFLAALEEAGVSLNIMGEETRYSDLYQSGSDDAQTAIWFVLVAVAVMISYRQMHEAKRTGVLLMYGARPIGVWFEVSGRMVVVTMGVLTAAGTLMAALIPGSTADLVATTLVRLVGMTMLLLAASLCTLFAIRSISLRDALKNRKDTRSLAVLGLVVKGILSVALVYASAASASWYMGAREQLSRYGGWEATSDYGVFYPYYTGMDASESMLSGKAETVFELYPILNEDGALYVQADDFLALSFGYGLPEFPSIRVNPNYLELYPIYDADGASIEISEDETDWVLLVPEHYRGQESKIVESWEERRLGANGNQSAWEADISSFSRTVDDPKPDQGIKIIWTAVGQQAFSFNTDVYPESANMIEDPIVEVMTTGNSAGIDRANSVNGSMNAALKVNLIGGDTGATFDHYAPLLQELGLSDNMRYLVTIDEAVSSLMQEYDREMSRQLVQVVMMLALFVVLALQSVPLLFELDARRVAVRRLYGYPFFFRQTWFFLVFGCSWSAVIAVIAACDIFGWPGGLQRQDPALLMIVVGAFMALEALLSVGALRYVEGRRVVDVLKGEI